MTAAKLDMAIKNSNYRFFKNVSPEIDIFESVTTGAHILIDWKNNTIKFVEG